MTGGDWAAWGTILATIFAFFGLWLRDKRHVSDTLKDLGPKTDALLSIAGKMESLHDVKDRDGVPIWYHTQSMRAEAREIANGVRNMEKLSQATDRLAAAVESSTTTQLEVVRILERIQAEGARRKEILDGLDEDIERLREDVKSVKVKVS